MPITTSFTCSNGHTFTAIAKLRSRCPECGMSARRDFTATPTTSTGPSKQPISSVSLSDKVDKKKTSDLGSKRVSITKKEKLSRSGTEELLEPKSQISTKPSPRIVKMGTPRPVKKTSQSKQVSKVVKPVTKRTVTARRKAPAGASPSVRTKLPGGSKERKVVEQLKGDEGPFWRKVQRKYGW